MKTRPLLCDIDYLHKIIQSRKQQYLKPCEHAKSHSMAQNSLYEGVQKRNDSCVNVYLEFNIARDDDLVKSFERGLW